MVPVSMPVPVQAMDNLMPGFDKEIARLAQRLLIQGRPIDFQTGVIASKVTPGVPGECARGLPRGQGEQGSRRSTARHARRAY